MKNILDKLIKKIKPNSVMFIHGKNATGKTTLVLQLATILSLDFNNSIFIFTNSLRKEDIIVRMLSSRTSIELSKILKNDLTKEDFEVIYKEAEILSNSSIYMNDTSSGIYEIIEKLKVLNEKNKKPDFVIIDNVSSMKDFNKKEFLNLRKICNLGINLILIGLESYDFINEDLNVLMEKEKDKINISVTYENKIENFYS